MAHVRLQNRSGRFVAPTTEAFQAAAANADWSRMEEQSIVLTNQPGEETWPITGASYILMHENQRDERVAEAALDFFTWCYEHGARDAEALHYVPMPDEVVTHVKKLWKAKLKYRGKPLL
jgi:phosphate transport system substrate-binding protein